MAKGKVCKRITDFAAGLVEKNDKMQIKLAKFCSYILISIGNIAAASVNATDNNLERISRLILKLKYRLAKYIDETKHRIKKANINKRKWVYNIGVLFLVTIATVVVYNSATCFEYSYNDKVLGYVKDQEDVNRILELASDELSKEHNLNLKINSDENISYKRVSKTDRTMDSEDMVLKKFTYLSDISTTATAINIDGKDFVLCSDEKAAKDVLKKVQKEILGEDDLSKYKSVKFKEDVELKEVKTSLTAVNSEKQAVEKVLSGGMETETYEIKEGDTVFDLCNKFGITQEELGEMNPTIAETGFIGVGDVIVLNKPAAALTVVTVEVSTFAEPIEFETEYRDDSDLYKGDTRVYQKGEDGKKKVKAKLIKENGKTVKRKDLSSEVLQEPVKEIVFRGTTERPKTAATGNLIFPVPGGTITSEFGYRWGRLHTGLDIAGYIGLPIRAADGGTVVTAGYSGGYGLCIDINHGNGMKTRYAHCSSLSVSVGDKVYQGQNIGYVGNTGNSTGPHCHFEVIINGTQVNPRGYV